MDKEEFSDILIKELAKEHLEEIKENEKKLGRKLEEEERLILLLKLIKKKLGLELPIFKIEKNESDKVKLKKIEG